MFEPFCFFLATAPEQWTSIPLQVKIYKLLLNELLNAMESNVSQQASAGGEDLEEVSIKRGQLVRLVLVL